MWFFYALAVLWALGCIIACFLISLKIAQAKGRGFLLLMLPLLLPATFLIGAVPLLTLQEIDTEILATLPAEDWACTDGYEETGTTIAANTSQRLTWFVCTRYERLPD